MAVRLLPMVFPAPSNATYRFGLFEADVAGSTLLRNGVRVRLQEQPFRVLCLLLARADELVTRDELRQALWPADTYVEFDGSLNAALKRLRATLGDNADNPTFIETVPKRGYRFIAPVSRGNAPSGMNQGTDEQTDSVLTNAAGPPIAPAGRPSTPPHRWKWTIAATVIAFLIAAFLLWPRPSAVRLAQAQTTPVIAVLPFQNEQENSDLDFLRFAIPEDIVTDLTYARSLSVRPFATTSKYGGKVVDPEKVGHDLKVTHLISGEFLRESSNLQITMELIDVATNRALWRKTIVVDRGDLLGLHKALEQSVHNELLSELKTPGSLVGDVPTPHNAHAFDIYLKSLSVPRDPAPNKQAIHGLEEAVALDPDYAPAWTELGWRYYIDGHYADGGSTAMARSEQASRRAISLDPHGTANVITMKAERGDLKGGYQEARSLLERRPDASVAHYEMSYVLRYAGMLEEAGQECDRALRLDPGNFLFRSCATAFFLQGNYARAQDYIRLDEGSGFAARSKLNVALRQQQLQEASAVAAQAVTTGSPWAELISARLAGRSDSDLAVIGRKLQNVVTNSADPEDMYETATALSFAGQSTAASRMLRMSIEHHYCSYPVMTSDPLLESLRQRPEFADLKAAGMRCQQEFLTYR